MYPLGTGSHVGDVGRHVLDRGCCTQGLVVLPARSVGHPPSTGGQLMSRARHPGCRFGHMAHQLRDGAEHLVESRRRLADLVLARDLEATGQVPFPLGDLGEAPIHIGQRADNELADEEDHEAISGRDRASALKMLFHMKVSTAAFTLSRETFMLTSPKWRSHRNLVTANAVLAEVVLGGQGRLDDPQVLARLGIALDANQLLAAGDHGLFVHIQRLLMADCPGQTVC
jgi:hypothetical protein